MAKPTPPASKTRKLTEYICELKGGRKVEVLAEKMMDVGGICHKKYGEFPASVKKKPFKMPEHLTQRLSSHEGLRELRKSMNNSKAERK